MKSFVKMFVSMSIGVIVGVALVSNTMSPFVQNGAEDVDAIVAFAEAEAYQAGYQEGYSVRLDIYDQIMESKYRQGYSDGQTAEFTAIADLYDQSVARYQAELDGQAWYDFTKPSNDFIIRTDANGEERTIVFASDGVISR